MFPQSQRASWVKGNGDCPNCFCNFCVKKKLFFSKLKNMDETYITNFLAQNFLIFFFFGFSTMFLNSHFVPC